MLLSPAVPRGGGLVGNAVAVPEAAAAATTASALALSKNSAVSCRSRESRAKPTVRGGDGKKRGLSSGVRTPTVYTCTHGTGNTFESNHFDYLGLPINSLFCF